VVATEVRNLAQRSAAAAKEIKALIDDSVEKVGSGTKLVEQAGSTMHEVVSSIKQVTDIVGEISAATQEQNDGIAQVHRAVTEMDQTTQQNSSLVEQTAAAATAARPGGQAGSSGQRLQINAARRLRGTSPRCRQSNRAAEDSTRQTCRALQVAAKPAPQKQKASGDEWEEF
jgi:methyl-accepting chemotaxis protein